MGVHAAFQLLTGFAKLLIAKRPNLEKRFPNPRVGCHYKGKRLFHPPLAQDLSLTSFG